MRYIMEPPSEACMQEELGCHPAQHSGPASHTELGVDSTIFKLMHAVVLETSVHPLSEWALGIPQ